MAASGGAESPVIRGGLLLAAGVLTGNVIGFGRVWLTAYLLGTHSRADSLAVAMGPMDTLNSVLINSVVFAFVPMLTAARGEERTALFLKLARCFLWVSAAVTAVVLIAAPGLMDVLAPGLDPLYRGTAVTNLRIFSLSTIAACVGAVQCALLFTDRRFLPTAFYQAALNLFTIIGALSLWKFLGVYAFSRRIHGGGLGAVGDCLLCRSFPAQEEGPSGLPGPVARTARQARLFRNLCRRSRPEHHLHPRLCHPRRTRHGRGARLLYARRGRPARHPGQPHLQLPAAGNRAAPHPAPPPRRLPPDRSHRRPFRPGRRVRLRLRPDFPRARHQDHLPARKIHRGIHPHGVGRLPGARAQPGGLEPYRNRGRVRCSRSIAPGSP